MAILEHAREKFGLQPDGIKALEFAGLAMTALIVGLTTGGYVLVHRPDLHPLVFHLGMAVKYVGEATAGVLTIPTFVNLISAGYDAQHPQ